MHRNNRRRFCYAAAAFAAWGPPRLFAQSLTGTLKTLPDFPNLKQPDDVSCGPTCAAMVLRWYGIDAGVERCKTKAGTRWLELGEFKVGMTVPSGLADCLNSFGLAARVVGGTVDDVVRCIDQGRPPILLVRSGVKTWHWVVAMGYYDGGARIKLSDPSGRQWVINRGPLDGAWTFSTDLDGAATGGRPCATCGGSGKFVKAPVPCTNCAGTGKMISALQVKKCSKCGGSGEIKFSGGTCLACGGSKKSPDMFRKAVETAKVTGHTMVVPDRGRASGGGGGTPQGRIVKLQYTIKNDAGRVVRFEMQPSGKSYSLDPGKTFQGTSNEVDGKAPTLTLVDSRRTYKVTAGRHKFIWMNNERRIGFDRSTD